MDCFTSDFKVRGNNLNSRQLWLAQTPIAMLKNTQLREIYHMPCTFLYEGGFIVRLINFPAYGGTKDIAPIAATLQTKPLSKHISNCLWSHWGLKWKITKSK